MKKIIFAILTLGVVGAGLQTAKAGDHEWAIAGKVLTGLAAASVITHAVQPAPVYYPADYYSSPAPAYSYNYCLPPVVVYRAPVYFAPRPVFFGPPPFVSFRFGSGGHRHFHRW